MWLIKQNKMTKPTKKLSSKRTTKLAPKSSGLNLSHRRHSGRFLPHSHTSYPALAMLLLFVAVLLGGFSRAANALTLTGSNSYQVTASYLGLPPATAATIDSPLDGVHVKAVPVILTGKCPANSYIGLTRNGLNSGYAICGALGSYSLQTDLFPGINALQAQVYSQFDLPGPASNTVRVTYDVPATAVPAPSTTGTAISPTAPKTGAGPVATSAPIAQPLLIKSTFKYVGRSVGQNVAYQFEIVGGSAPYAISINWGDGTQKTLSLTQTGAFSVNHSYAKTGQYKGSYRIQANAGDAGGQQTELQLLAIINDRPIVPAAGSKIDLNAGNDGGIGRNLQNVLKYLWPTFGVTVLMGASFWLGELRELRHIRLKPGQSRHA